jgi:hypothetical protein
VKGAATRVEKNQPRKNQNERGGPWGRLNFKSWWRRSQGRLRWWVKGPEGRGLRRVDMREEEERTLPRVLERGRWKGLAHPPVLVFSQPFL